MEKLLEQNNKQKNGMKIKIIIDYNLMMKLLPPEDPNESSKIFDKIKIEGANMFQVQAYENGV